MASVGQVRFTALGSYRAYPTVVCARLLCTNHCSLCLLSVCSVAGVVGQVPSSLAALYQTWVAYWAVGWHMQL